MMSRAAILLQGLITVALGQQLSLQALTVRACMLVLAASAAFATLRWGRVAYRELHRFIVLLRRTILVPCMTAHCPVSTALSMLGCCC